MKKHIFLFLLFFCGIHSTEALIIEVPNTYGTIQEGIQSAADGDTVLVAPGTYFENINFRGKNIIVASEYLIHGDINTIKNTIIDGSTPVHSDSASCVLFTSGETREAVLAGFTLVNGRGTATWWKSDTRKHRGGGGIVVHQSSPTIKNNLIMNNGPEVESGIFNGGGIDIHQKSCPVIQNNVIKYNVAGFGGGISLWDSANAIIRNNIIAENRGGYMYGGAGLALDLSAPLIDNNVIMNNASTGSGNQGNGTGGAIVVWRANPVGKTATMHNNIIWGNTQQHGDPIEFQQATANNLNLHYSVVQEGFNGFGIIEEDPQCIANYMLHDQSPCIDAGSTSERFNDIEDVQSVTNALLPSKGTIVNDMGVYGGAYAMELPDTVIEQKLPSSVHSSSFDSFLIAPNPASDQLIITYSEGVKAASFEIYNLSGVLLISKEVKRAESFLHVDISNLAQGVYLSSLVMESGEINTNKLIVK